MRRYTATFFLVGSCLVANVVDAFTGSPDKYQITAEEQTACGNDAVYLCATAYPDEDKLLACMKANRPRLSAMCRPIFDEGLRRRHIN